MKKAFTLAEILVTLTVVGVLLIITIPVINNARPDKDKVIFKKAMYTTNAALANIMEENQVKKSANLLAGEFMSASSFCDLFSEAVNTTGKIDCTSSSSYNSPNFITSDGIRFWGLEGKVFDVPSVEERTIHIDRKLTSSEINRLSSLRDSDHSDKDTGLRIKISYEGKVSIDNDWTYEKNLSESLYN